MQDKSILAWQNRLKAYTKAQKITMAQLAEMLDLKPRALQRRFAGQTAWSLSEYLQATHITGLPPIPEPNIIRLRYQDRTAGTGFDESAYLTNLEIAAEPLFQGTGSIDVSSTDIPMFYLLGCPLTLEAKFMIFAGGKKMNQKFTSSFLARCDRLAKHYRETPRREIWGIAPLRTFIYQLEYLASLRLLDLQQLDGIFQELRALLSELETQLLDRASGLILRHDDLRVTTTMYRVVPTDAPGTAYLSYDNPDAFATADIESNRWFEGHFKQLWDRTSALDSSRPIRNYFAGVQQEFGRRIERIKESFDEVE